MIEDMESEFTKAQEPNTAMPNAEIQNAEMRAINEKLVITAVRQQELAETALQSAENAQKSGELYRLLAGNFPNGMVLLFDQDLRHILAGGRGLAMLGLSKEAMEGSTIWERFSPVTCRQIEPGYRAALAGETTLTEVLFPCEMPFQEMQERVYQVHALPAKDDQGNILSGMAVAQDITEQRRADETIRRQAYHDPLTGLPNRALLRDRLDQVLAISERSGELAALLFLDLDHFKQVNDTWGHVVGDRLLETVAARLTGCLRAEDTVARLGGDEFVVLLPSLQAAGGAAEVAQKIVMTLGAPMRIAGMENHELSVTASVGISIFPSDGCDADSLMKKADAAMYQAKKNQSGHPVKVQRKSS